MEQDKVVHYLLILLVVLATTIRQQKEIKRTQIRKEDIKLLLFADYMIVHITDLKISTKELLQLINTFSNISGYKMSSKKSVALIYK